MERLLKMNSTEAVDKFAATILAKRVTRLIVDQWSVGFLADQFLITVEGEWKLFDSDKVLLDQSVEVTSRTEMMLWKIVGSSIVASTPRLDNSLEVKFSNGLELLITARDDEFEDWQVSAPGGFLLVVNGSAVTVFGSYNART